MLALPSPAVAVPMVGAPGTVTVVEPLEPLDVLPLEQATSASPATATVTMGRNCTIMIKAPLIAGAQERRLTPSICAAIVERI
jgi:hypothetical protein